MAKLTPAPSFGQTSTRAERAAAGSTSQTATTLARRGDRELSSSKALVMIDGWSSPSERTAFLAGIFGRQPYAQPGAALSSVALLDWGTIDRVLAFSPLPDAIAVAAGGLVETRTPRSSAEVRALMRRGISTVVRASERNEDGLHRLAAAFHAVLPGAVHVQLYATPAGTHSYGWHYDFEDVFIVQTLGIKDYYMRANTVARHTWIGGPLDFSAVREERSPLMKARLIAGDWLYIPRRWWHFVECLEESLSISVGVMPPGADRRTAGAVRP